MMTLDKDAFVGIHELDGIRCRIMFVFPNLKLFAWRLDEPGWAVFALQRLRIYFGGASPNCGAEVRPYLIRRPALAHKNPTCFSRGSMSTE